MCKMLRFQQIPYMIVLFSFLISWFAEISQNTSLNSLPDVLAILIFIFLFVSGRINLPYKVILYAIPIIIIFSVLIYYNIYLGRALTGGSGFFAITVLTLIFYCMLYNSDLPGQVNVIARQISTLYLIHIVYIAIEMVVLITHDYEYMKSIFPAYRNLKGQPIYSFLGMESPGSANGIMVGAQVASQMLALSLIWFVPVYSYNIFKLKNISNYFIWFFTAVLFLMCMTGTSVVMLFVMLVCLLFFIPAKIVNPWFRNIRPILIVVLFLSSFYGLKEVILYRVPTTDLYEFYIKVFFQPIVTFVNLPIEKILFGMQSDYSLAEYTDFGMGAIVWSSGVLVAFVVLLSFFSLLVWAVVSINRKRMNRSNYYFRCITLAGACLIGSIAWFVSLFHYTVATETGGKQMFAFVIAATLYSVMKMRVLEKSECEKSRIA